MKLFYEQSILLRTSLKFSFTFRHKFKSVVLKVRVFSLANIFIPEQYLVLHNSSS